jgi:tetratricopeptide (TPR) repeat protein
MNRQQKRLNVVPMLVILAVAVAAVVAIAIVHRLQTARNAGSLASLARSKVAEGKPAEALGLFARYLAYRPDDATAQAEFARLIVTHAERPSATKNDRSYAYNVLETAVRKNPGDNQLRRQLAEWMLRFGRYGDALAEITILSEQATAASGGSDGRAPDADSIELLRARALAGKGEFQAAAASAAAVLGFDLTTQSFKPNGPARSAAAGPREDDTTLQASLILASLLEQKLNAPDAAAAVLERLVALNSEDFRAWLTLARWHQSRGELAKAAESVRTAARIAPDEPDVLFTDLELSVAEQRFTVADQLANRARSLFPNDERSFRGQATVAVQQGDLERAIAVLNEGLTEQAGQPSLLLMLADVLLQNNQLEKADEVIGAFIERHGATSPAVGLLEARILIAQKRWLPAKQKLDSVRPLVAESVSLTKQVDLCLGQCHEMLGQFDEQLAANQRVLSEDHESLAARIGMAGALAASGKPDAALAEYEAVAVSLPPDGLPAVPRIWNPLLQLRIANLMRQPAADRDWTSVDQLIELLEQSPAVSDSQVALLRADVLVRKGLVPAAFAVLKKQVEADASSPQALAALAVLTMREQGPAAAQSLLDTSPPEIADDPVLLMARAQVAARSSPDESAAALARIEKKALGLPAESSIRLLSVIASIHRGMGERGEAERVWQTALEQRPDDIGIRTALFELFCEEGSVEKAQAAAAELSRLSGPTSPQGRMATAAALVLGVRTTQAHNTSASSPLSDEEKEQLIAARNLLIEAENDRPGWPQIQQLHAEIAGLQGDLPAAIDRLQQAMRLGPTSPAVIRRLVSLLYATNRLEEAQQAIATVGPDGLDGIERISAEIDLRNGQFDNAVALAERSLAGGKQNTAGDLLWFGQLLARAGKTDRAVDVLQQAVDADPLQSAAWMALFASQLATGNQRAAERTLEQGGEKLAPPQRQMFIARGSEMLGRVDDAERSFREALVAVPGDAAASRGLVAFLIRRGRLTAAREELQTMLASTPDDAAGKWMQGWARRTLAELTVQQGSYQDVERTLALLDSNADADGVLPPDDLALQAMLLAPRPEPSSWRRAVAILDTLAAQQPLTTTQRMQKAQLLEQLGRWDECRNELLSIVSAPNTPPAVQSLLIEKLVRHGDLDAARIWLKTLAGRLPDAPVVSALQARLALAENDRAGAMAAIRKLMPDESSSPGLAGQFGPLASLLEELGFQAAAETVFTQFAAASSDGVIARAGFLARAARADESLDLLEASWERIPLDNLLRTAISVLASQGDGRTSQQSERVGKWFEKARRQDPDSSSLALLFADFVGMTGSREEVVKIYRAVLDRKDLSPQLAAVASNNLAFHLAEPETVAEAEKLVATALAELGPHPDVLDTRGVVLLAAGQGRRAIEDLQEAVLSPSPAKYIHLASALVSERQLDAARKALEEARKIGFQPEQLSPGDRKRLKAVESALGG